MAQYDIIFYKNDPESGVSLSEFWLSKPAGSNYALSQNPNTGVLYWQLFEPAFTKNNAFNKSFGAVADSVCQGNDNRLSDARTPLAHNHTFDSITSKPTTLAGYGITDGSSIALGELESNAYRGDRGVIAFNHSQVSHAPSTAQKNSDITKAEIEAKLIGEISSHSHAGGGGGIAGSSYIFVAADGTEYANATALQAAYTLAKTLSPSNLNRITIIAAPGRYNFNGAHLNMDTAYIDLVSLDGNRSIYFVGPFTTADNNCIKISANNVFVCGVDVSPKSFKVEHDLSSVRFENCKGGANSFGYYCIASGTYIDCEAGNYSFGSNTMGGSGRASGTFTRCSAGSSSFGSSYGYASGIFTDCKATSGGFAAYGTASGTFFRCQDNGQGFGSGGTSSGYFYQCVGGSSSWKDGLTGKLYHCTKSFGTFTVTGSGRIYFCVDGNGTPVTI